ncbi:MAG: hypothetical protein P4M11_03145, partial [Candidatus Pacebacteria bacterium]|nr:hypothetical protein [Candidatus Paceibacterota bacterium]
TYTEPFPIREIYYVDARLSKQKIEIMDPRVSTSVDQEALLDEATARSSQSAALMRVAIEEGNLRQALFRAEQMLCELRISALDPRYYYLLCTLLFHDKPSRSHPDIQRT